MTTVRIFSGLMLSSLLCMPAVAAPHPVVQQALNWKDKTFELGKAEQCMNWTRTVLQQACGAQFASLQTEKPWDLAQLGPDDVLLPEHADSLASEEFGQKITTIAQLQAGDLVFLQNTYGNWKPGVITHIGIATGNGQYIHRMTSNEGFVRVEPIPAADFHAGLRLDPMLCKPQP